MLLPHYTASVRRTSLCTAPSSGANAAFNAQARLPLHGLNTFRPYKWALSRAGPSALQALARHMRQQQSLKQEYEHRPSVTDSGAPPSGSALTRAARAHDSAHCIDTTHSTPRVHTGLAQKHGHKAGHSADHLHHTDGVPKSGLEFLSGSFSSRD